MSLSDFRHTENSFEQHRPHSSDLRDSNLCYKEFLDVNVVHQCSKLWCYRVRLLQNTSKVKHISRSIITKFLHFVMPKLHSVPKKEKVRGSLQQNKVHHVSERAISKT